MKKEESVLTENSSDTTATDIEDNGQYSRFVSCTW